MAQSDDMIREDLIAQGPRPPAGIGELVDKVKADLQQLVQSEIALAKAELIPQAKSGGIGAGLFLVAAYFGMNGLSLLFLSAALAVAQLFDAPTGGVALGFLIVAVVVFVIAGLFAGVGLLFVKKVKGPERTIAQAQASIETIKDAVTRATANVKTTELERKTFRHPEALR